MSYYRVTCMAGVMSSTIGELLIIHARTTLDRLYQYWYQFFVQGPATLFSGWSLQLAILTTINTLNICTLFLACYYKYHFILIFIVVIIIRSSSPSLSSSSSSSSSSSFHHHYRLSWPPPLPPSS